MESVGILLCYLIFLDFANRLTFFHGFGMYEMRGNLIINGDRKGGSAMVGGNSSGFDDIDLSKKVCLKLFYRVLTPSGGKYIISGAQLDFARTMGPSWFGLYSMGGRKEGERDEQIYSLPLGMSDISVYVEQTPDTEPIGRATVEEPSSEKPPFEVSGY